MITWNGLSERQIALVSQWLPSPILIRDLSWGQVDTVVLHVRADGEDFIVKAAGAANHHIGREITAHESFTAPLTICRKGAGLIAADRDANLLLLEYLDGSLVEGSAAEFQADSYEQAGRLLRMFHSQTAAANDQSEQRATQKALAWLDRTHRVTPEVEAAARSILTDYRPRPVTVVPTHGDWHPRNWLIDSGEVKVIDFGRFDLRPAATDLCRLAVQQWRVDESLEAAFLEGYGTDPRDEELWRIMLLREAVATAVWAYQVGDAAFEAQGHRMLTEAIALLS